MDPRFFVQAKGQNLDPVLGNVARQIRRRCTLAEINAGVDILPARKGIKYRLIDSTVIPVGGAFAALTTLDITATAAGSSRKLVTHAQANLTQSIVSKPFSTGGTVLADGASFTVNDENTAVRVSKTGASGTTATAADVILTYAVEFSS